MEQCAAKRAAFRERVAAIASERFVFLDEMGVRVGMTPLYGRAPGGKRVVDRVPRKRGDNLSVIGALRLGGVGATMTITGAVDTTVFNTYLEQCLVLRPGDVVVLDNLKVHVASAVARIAEARGATVVWLPPYSPDFNPIEKLWSKAKTLIRAAKAQTLETLEGALKVALEAVTAPNIQGWFRHCGYSLQGAST